MQLRTFIVPSYSSPKLLVFVVGSPAVVPGTHGDADRVCSCTRSVYKHGSTQQYVAHLNITDAPGSASCSLSMPLTPRSSYFLAAVFTQGPDLCYGVKH